MTNKKRSSSCNLLERGKEVSLMEEGYTPYGYIGLVDDELIEVVSESELYELLDDDNDEM